MDTSKKYILMCEKAPGKLWDKVEHYGSFMAWRSFIGIVMPDPKKTKWEGLSSVIPETLVLRTWLKEGEETLIVLKTDVNYGGSNGDRGTPLYRQDQLQGSLEETLGKKLRKSNKYTYAYREYPEGYMTSCILWEFSQWEDKTRGYRLFASMEQLWLAFVMKEKFKKVWNDKKKKWEKID